MDSVLDQKVLGTKSAKARAPGAALAAAGLEVALPVPCPGAPSTLGMASSRDLGFCRGSTALLASLKCGCCSLRCRHSQLPAVPRVHGHSWSNGSCSHLDQRPACPAEPHGALHLSCRKDLKCIEGSWERASLTTGKKQKQTRRQLCPCNRLCSFSAGKKHVPLPAESWAAEQELHGLVFPVLHRSNTLLLSRAVRVAGRYPAPLPTRPRETPPGLRDQPESCGMRKRKPEQRLGHQGRESKCL